MFYFSFFDGGDNVSGWELFRVWLETFGILLAVFVALFAERIKAWWAKPKLELKLRSDKGNPTYFNSGVSVYYYHLVLKNNNQNGPLYNSRVLLEEVWLVYNDGALTTVPLASPSQLLWVPAEFHEYDPYPTIGGGRVCDLGHVDEQIKKFLVGLWWKPNNFRGDITPGQKMRYVFSVDGSNYQKFRFYALEIFWDGEWVNNDPTEFAEHLIIRECPVPPKT